MNDLVRVLRGQRIDGRGTDEIMRLAADEIESLRSRLAERALIVARAENAEAALVEADERHGRYVKAVGELAGMAAQRDRAVGHLRDVLAADDGQAWKEARRFLDGIDPPSEEDMSEHEPVIIRYVVGDTEAHIRYHTAADYDELRARLAEADALLREALPSVQSHIRKHRRSWEAAMKRGDEFHTRKHCEQMNKDLALESRIDAHLAGDA
jgi:hypothetical protein